VVFLPLSSIERLADNIITNAVESHASDVHIIPRKKDTLVQLRIANKLFSKQTFSTEDCDRLISHFKFKASMDIGERRRPQSGAYSFTTCGQIIGLRLSTLPASHSESLVIRILPQQESVPFFQISLYPSMTRKLLALLKHAHGLIILTGPTGSGKTSTLYALLNETMHIFSMVEIT